MADSTKQDSTAITTYRCESNGWQIVKTVAVVIIALAVAYQAMLVYEARQARKAQEEKDKKNSKDQG